MRLYLENIGKLSQADIDIKGITVIAGENNTGKSTVGKVLFAVFNSLYNFEQEVIETRIRLFAQELRSAFEEKYDDYIIDAKAVSKVLFNTNEKITKDLLLKLLKEQIKETDGYFELLQFDENGHEIINNTDIFIDTKFLESIEKMFYKYQDISVEKIYSVILNRTIKNEFDLQIVNVYSNSESGRISLEIRDKSVNITFKDDQIEKIEKDIASLQTEVSYIDDPLILDNMGFYMYLRSAIEPQMLAHKFSLISNLVQRKKSTEIEEAFHEVIASEKLEYIMKKIDKICNGSLSFKSGDGFWYYDKKSESNFNVKNVSAGLKTFAIIKTLLYNGSLKENGTIILDEPEVHLHPEWQILLAEIIVLLHKEFNMHILLTTHSPYFLEAIEVYSQKYEVNEKCKYYLAENHGDSAKIYDVTHNTEAIYKKLAQPFQDLENERYNSD